MGLHYQYGSRLAVPESHLDDCSEVLQWVTRPAALLQISIYFNVINCFRTGA